MGCTVPQIIYSQNVLRCSGIKSLHCLVEASGAAILTTGSHDFPHLEILCTCWTCSVAVDLCYILDSACDDEA